VWWSKVSNPGLTGKLIWLFLEWQNMIMYQTRWYGGAFRWWYDGTYSSWWYSLTGDVIMHSGADGMVTHSDGVVLHSVAVGMMVHPVVDGTVTHSLTSGMARHSLFDVHTGLSTTVKDKCSALYFDE